jgi:hypothetical protein
MVQGMMSGLRSYQRVLAQSYGEGGGQQCANDFKEHQRQRCMRKVVTVADIVARSLREKEIMMNAMRVD